jgi:predicted ATP-dependent protease
MQKEQQLLAQLRHESALPHCTTKNRSTAALHNEEHERVKAHEQAEDRRVLEQIKAQRRIQKETQKPPTTTWLVFVIMTTPLRKAAQYVCPAALVLLSKGMETTMLSLLRQT